jgi:hypothetical protein
MFQVYVGRDTILAGDFHIQELYIIHKVSPNIYFTHVTDILIN